MNIEKVLCESFLNGLALLIVATIIHFIDMQVRGDNAMSHVALAAHVFFSGVIVQMLKHRCL